MKKLAAGNEATTPGAASGRQLPHQEKSSQPPPDIVFNHLPLGLRDAVCSQQTISTIFKQLQANICQDYELEEDFAELSHKIAEKTQGFPTLIWD